MDSARDDSTLGLTLSGGGAYGAAHVGVLQELEERGIRPGIVAGTSSGALVAAAYAADVPQDGDRASRARVPVELDRAHVTVAAAGDCSIPAR